MDSYLIRIYRRSKDDPEGVVGVVEEIKTGLNHAFQGMSSLCKLLSLEEFPEKGWPDKNTSNTKS
jgi:predicted transcriptional regulator with HTH domain